MSRKNVEKLHLTTYQLVSVSKYLLCVLLFYLIYFILVNTIISMKTFDFVFPDEDKLDLNEGAVDVDGRCTLPSVEDENLKITWVDIQVALSSISNRDWVWTWWFPILRLLILIKLTKILDRYQFEQIIISCIKIIFIYICIYQTVIVKWFISGFLIRNDRRSVVRFGPGPESPLDWTVRGPCFGISTFNLSFGLNLWSFDLFHLSYATCYLVQIIVGTISFNFLVFSKLCSHHLV